MRTHVLVLVLACAAPLLGCVSDGPAAPAPEGKPAAPLRVQLQGRADGDRLELEAVVSAAGRLAGAPVLRLVLPEGAVLESGAAEETLPALPKDPAISRAETRRRWVVRGAKGPVRVRVEAGSHVAGARAEAVWPPEPGRPLAAPAEPIAPVKVHGATVDEAVPLDR